MGVILGSFDDEYVVVNSFAHFPYRPVVLSSSSLVVPICQLSDV